MSSLCISTLYIWGEVPPSNVFGGSGRIYTGYNIIGLQDNNSKTTPQKTIAQKQKGKVKIHRKIAQQVSQYIRLHICTSIFSSTIV